MNKKWIITIIISAMVLVLLFFPFWGSETKEKEKNDEEVVVNETKEKESKEVVKYEERLHTVIQNHFHIEAQGYIAQAFDYDKKNYLTINKINPGERTEKYPGDKILWVSEKDGEVKYQNLTSGENIVSVIKENGVPFIKVKKETFIVYYERSGLPDLDENGIDYNFNLKGYVYKINKDNSLEKVYETSEAFEDLKRDKYGNIVLVEKIYKDDFNQYPTMFKPYELVYKKYEKEKFVEIKRESFDPAKEQIEREKK